MELSVSQQISTQHTSHSKLQDAVLEGLLMSFSLMLSMFLVTLKAFHDGSRVLSSMEN